MIYLKQFGVIAILTILSTITGNKSHAQCNMSVTSTNGYTVHITTQATRIIAPSSCPWGYNFDVEVDYSVTFTGSNIPSTLYTLNGYLTCGSYKDNYFPLPKIGGSGKINTNANVWRSETDCNTLQPQDIHCVDFSILIQGPGIPSQTLTCSAPLPIELLSFEAKAGKLANTLTWATASETNNDYFEIERSSDGKIWDVISRKSGAGTSLSTVQYEAIDSNPPKTVTFYRLKQTDFDGTYTYSGIAVAAPEKTKHTTIYPNPAQQTITLKTTNGSLNTVVISNAHGQIVQEMTSEIYRSNEIIQIDISQLPNGLYFVTTDVETIRFNKN